jgi:RimJ/RimL family protein N-acetyltransferase
VPDPVVTLRPFTAGLLPAVQPWFHHPEVNRWLGGPDWPAAGLREAGRGIGEMFRGRRVLRTHSWAGCDAAGEVVALVGGEVYDRWRRPGDGPSMGLAYVVAPALWGRGVGAAALRALVTAPAVADVAVFFAGVEPANVASARCAMRAGFVLDDPEPDFEGFVFYRYVPRKAG